ncbi:MAG: hypothetical protein D6763_08970 [Alphaproteobacteria bacterium]|nr:MAG: hypothetical protein D6763_08970 [Alphaproteobacteria bacterium]
MAKKVDDSVLDAALDALKNNCNMMTACAGEPASYAEGVEPAAWQASTAYGLGEVVRPVTRNGFNYECTTAGTSGASEPTWPTTPGTTVNDGTVVWTARTARQLADVAMSGTDFTHADGDTSGRKTTVGSKSGITVDASGTADHVALLDTTNRTLLYVTTATSQVLTAGNTLTINAWDVEIADPS